MSRIWRWVAPMAVAGGLVAASGAVPAQAASTTSLSVTIKAKNPGYPNIGRDTIVFYGNKLVENADISGAVTGATAGDVVTLLAKPFKAKGFAPTGKPQTLTASTQDYSFSVRPTLATAYEAQVTTGSTVDATSAVQFVYVGLLQVVGKNGYHYKCDHVGCTLSITTRTLVPASAYRTEAAKRWYLYLAVSRSRGKPSEVPPKYLPRVTKNASASKATRVSATDFQVVFKFWIAYDGKNFYPFPDACTKDVEAKDGIGLPGHHGCGASKISTASFYIG
jgi:hypothetical protein